MYRKRDQSQMTVEDFIPPLGGKLYSTNRWVLMSQIVPWDMVEDIYSRNFKVETSDGRPPISARMAFGALYIKESENLSQEQTIQHISENLYMQYFLGLTEFNPKPLFDSSMLSIISTRFSKEDISQINEEIYRRMQPADEEPPSDGNSSDGGIGKSEDEPTNATESACQPTNKGKLILDATVAPADIRYPTDLSLLNECREDTEKIIDDVWGSTERKGHKTAYSRKKVRKEYLVIAKQRKPRKKQLRQAVRVQLECVEKNVAALEVILSKIGLESFGLANWARLMTISEVAGQQRVHYDNPCEPIPNRIVSLRQPHVRPIVRGKAGSEVEFGQKISLSVVDGYTFIENQSWNNFAEGITLIASAEKFRERHGSYPEAILADKTYRNRENIKFCKENGIRLSGPRLGRPKASEAEADKEQAYKDSCERNVIEGRIGIDKRRYGLDRIFARLEPTGEVEAAVNVVCMNVAHVLRTVMRRISASKDPTLRKL
jgi:hypothetical protein